MKYEELEKLNELKEKGVITEVEFRKEKEKILSQDDNKSQNNNKSQDNDKTQNIVFDVNIKGKSRIVAGILGILLGALGIHNFYLGYTGKAMVQLLITVLSIGILSWVSAIWGLIEGVMILVGEIDKDGRGNTLRS